MKLQPMLMDIISLNQRAFLPMRFIFNNLLLIQETLAWTKYSKQHLIFLKLGFSKAYNMVDWSFMFQAMSAIGFPTKFNNMVKFLFQDATTTINISGLPSPAFQIKCGVKQWCLLAPYLFIIVFEVLNAMVMIELHVAKV